MSPAFRKVGLSEDEIQAVLKGIEKFLRDPSVDMSINTQRGMKRIPNYESGFWEYEPTDAHTIEITIRTHGGACEIDGSDEALEKLLLQARMAGR